MNFIGAGTMNRKFDYSTFLSLNKFELVDYVEPLLSDRDLRLDPDDLQRLASDFPTFDEYHKVYGIELGADRLPATFAVLAFICFTDPSTSVRCAALRFLTRISPSLINDELIDRCRKACLADAPIMIPAFRFGDRESASYVPASESFLARWKAGLEDVIRELIARRGTERLNSSEDDPKDSPVPPLDAL